MGRHNLTGHRARQTWPREDTARRIPSHGRREIGPEDNGYTGALELGTNGKGERIRLKRIGENWTPRGLRHSFVPIMSGNGVSIEQIADLVGHRTTIVTQKVYTSSSRSLAPVRPR